MTLQNNKPQSKSQARIAFLLEQLRKDTTELLLSSPTFQQLNTVIGYLQSLDSTLGDLAEGQETFIAAAQALTEAIERLRSFSINANSLQIFSNEAKIWPKSDISIATPSDDGEKPKSKANKQPGESSVDKLRDHLEKHKGGQHEETN